MNHVFGRVRYSDGHIAYVKREGGHWLVLTQAPWEGPIQTTGQMLDEGSAELLCPVSPSKIVCVGRNYRAHAKELGHEMPSEPLLFLKPPSSLVGPDKPILLPSASKRVEHEAELGVVMGARCRDVPIDKAMNFVFGYTCINDVTARDLQKKDAQWTRAKGFDSFCPVGPWVVTGLEATNLRVRCLVNGTQRQEGSTRDMVFPLSFLISYISAIMTLEPGDLIATGTPEGVGALDRNDTVEVEIEGIGVLKNTVRSVPS